MARSHPMIKKDDWVKLIDDHGSKLVPLGSIGKVVSVTESFTRPGNFLCYCDWGKERTIGVFDFRLELIKEDTMKERVLRDDEVIRRGDIIHRDVGDPFDAGAHGWVDGGTVKESKEYRRRIGGSWEIWTKNDTMTNGGNNNWTTSGLIAPGDATDVEYYFTINTDGNSIYIYNGSLALTDTYNVAEGSPFIKSVLDNDAPLVTGVAVDTDPVYSGDLTQQVTVDFSEVMDTLVDPSISFSDGSWTAGGGSWVDAGGPAVFHQWLVISLPERSAVCPVCGGAWKRCLHLERLCNLGE